MNARRPFEEVARQTIAEFLDRVVPGYPDFKLYEDGDETAAEQKCGWAFWIDPSDTTSYLHEDLGIEWYGTKWED